MTRAEYLDNAKTIDEKADLLLTLVCESTKDCPHKCGECQKRITDFLEEDLDTQQG